MRTFAFVLFVVVTSAVAVMLTLAASRYLSLEKQLNEVTTQLEESIRVRKAQEEEKISLRLDRERMQADLEARLAEQKNQLDDCSTQNLRYSQEILGGLMNIQRRLTDLAVQAAPSAVNEPGHPASKPGEVPDVQEGKSLQSSPPDPDAPSRAADVKKGAVPTPTDEAQKLNQVR
ncbi:hypothetical protein JCM15519_34790 [Fundidesulfovibrio butyratiphilus]